MFARIRRDAGRKVLLVEMGVRRTYTFTAVLFLSRASVKSSDAFFSSLLALSLQPPHRPLLFLCQKRLSSCSPTVCLHAREDDGRAIMFLTFRKDAYTLNCSEVVDRAATEG